MFLVYLFIFLVLIIPADSAKAEGMDSMFRGKLKVYAKDQSSYDTSLDYGTGTIRAGANNRQDQLVRSKLELEFIPLSIGLHDPEDSRTRKWIGYGRLSFDPNDPDRNADNDDLGENLRIEDLWVRYSPVLPVGIRLGRFTIVQTINSQLSYEFTDFDDDFILYSASGVTSKDGVEVSAFLRKDFSLGMAYLQGMSRGGRIATNGASNTRSRTKVFWGKLDNEIIKAQLARQFVTASETYADERREYRHSHIFQNWLVGVDTLENVFVPFYGSQVLWGDKVYVPFNAQAVSGAVANVVPSESRCQSAESRRAELDFRTIGFYGKHKDISYAAERTYSSTPTYCSHGSVTPIVELDYMQHIEVSYEVESGIEVSLFSHHVKSKRDQSMRGDIDRYQRDLNTLSSIPADVSAITSAVSGYQAALKGQQWSDTTSTGISVTLHMPIF